MYLFLSQIDQVEEIAKRIQICIQKQNIFLFTKCELLQIFLEFNVQDKISISDFLEKRENYSNKLEITFVDLQNVNDHISEISKAYEKFNKFNLTFTGLNGKIQRYIVLKDSILVKKFIHKNSLRDCEQFRKELLDQYKNQKIVIEVEYSLLKSFFSKFMHEKEYFEKLTCIIRVVEYNKNSYHHNENQKNHLNLKLYKQISFCKNCILRDYNLYIDSQFFVKQNKKTYYLPSAEKRLEIENGTKTKILTEYLNSYNFEYYLQIDKKEYNYQYQCYQTIISITNLVSYLDFIKMLSISEEINCVEVRNPLSIQEEFNSLSSNNDNFNCLKQIASCLFDQQKIKNFYYYIQFSYDSDKNFDFLTDINCIPAQNTVIESNYDKFTITIKQIENLYYSELKLEKFSELFLREVAYSKKNLKDCLRLYEKIIKIINKVDQKENKLNIGEQLKIYEEVIQVEFFQKLAFKKIEDASQQKNLDILKQILINQTALEGLHLSFFTNLSDLYSFDFNSQIIDLVKKQCPDLKLFSMFIDNQKLIFDLLKSYDFKIFFKIQQFEVVQDTLKDDKQQSHNVLKFSLSGNYLKLFEQIFDRYRTQFDNLEQCSQIDKIKNNTQISKKDAHIKYCLQIQIDSQYQFDKLQLILSKLMQHLHFIDCFFNSEKVFSKQLETFTIYNLNNLKLPLQILQNHAKTLVIHEGNFYKKHKNILISIYLIKKCLKKFVEISYKFFIQLKGWNRNLNAFLETLSYAKITIEGLELNLIMYSYDESLTKILTNIGYKSLQINFYYDQLQLENLQTIQQSLKLNNYFYDNQYAKKQIEFKICLENQQSNYEKLECIKIIKEMSDNLFAVKCQVQGKKRLPKICKQVLQEVSIYQRIFASYSAMKQNQQLSKVFRNEIIQQICDFY